jgi:two-component system, OmpR family, alkaline phosphatase synthesis response regulator PhoP
MVHTSPLSVLVIDDEDPIVDLIAGYVGREGWRILRAADGKAGLAMARLEKPDVIVLDLMLPELDGIEVCRQLRAFSDAFVIMLTSRAEEIDKLVGLAVGADDYMTKPFSPRELVARIKAVTRRLPMRASGPGPLGLDVQPDRRQVTVDGQPVDLTRTEFDILAQLVTRGGAVVSRAELLATVWGPAFDDDHLVDVHVANLRRKLGDDPSRPRFVETVRGVGYRLVID